MAPTEGRVAKPERR